MAAVSTDRRKKLLAATAKGGKGAEELTAIFKTLADPTRLRILTALIDSELCVHDICAAVSMRQPAVSHQLRVLRDARLVRGRRSGREVYYRLDDEHVLTLLSEGLKHASHRAR